MAYLFLFVIPVLVALGFFVLSKHAITWKEFLVQIAVQAAVGGISAGVIYYANTLDTEVWNGRVASKQSERVSCSHSYQCNCRTYKCGKSTCTACSTCYEHPYDVDWAVYTTNSERIEIDRVDRRGLSEPPRFTSVRQGEPTAVTHNYENYIKAAPDTLFRREGEFAAYAGTIPAYPIGVYDYYRLGRMVTTGGLVVEPATWNEQLSQINADLGRAKQVNIVLVVTSNKPREWFYALERAWLGGKKNDVIVVVNVGAENRIEWVQVMSWTTREILKVSVRDDILAVGNLDREAILGAISRNVSAHFVRRPMADFDYLKATITPTPFQLGLAGVIGFLVSIGVGFFMVKNDLFNEEWRR